MLTEIKVLDYTPPRDRPKLCRSPSHITKGANASVNDVTLTLSESATPELPPSGTRLLELELHQINNRPPEPAVRIKVNRGIRPVFSWPCSSANCQRSVYSIRVLCGYDVFIQSHMGHDGVCSSSGGGTDNQKVVGRPRGLSSAQKDSIVGGIFSKTYNELRI